MFIYGPLDIELIKEQHFGTNTFQGPAPAVALGLDTRLMQGLAIANDFGANLPQRNPRHVSEISTFPCNANTTIKTNIVINATTVGVILQTILVLAAYILSSQVVSLPG